MAELSQGDPPERPAKCARVGGSLQSLVARFKCSITGDLFVDPVSTADGQVYERVAIEAWLYDHNTSPVTGAQLDGKALVPCPLARGAVVDLIEAGAVSVEEERDWLVRRGLMLRGSDAATAKRCYERAIEMGAAAAKYHLGCMLIQEAAEAGVPEARHHPALARSAAQMKAEGRSAVEAWKAGCSGANLYALCAKFQFVGESIHGEEGMPCVTRGGLFGTMTARDRDNCGPWIVRGVYEHAMNSWELIERVRPLRWA